MAAKSNSPSPIVKLAIGGIILMALFSANTGLKKAQFLIDELPVEGAALVVDPTTPAAPKDAPALAIYPVKTQATPKDKAANHVEGTPAPSNLAPESVSYDAANSAFKSPTLPPVPGAATNNENPTGNSSADAQGAPQPPQNTSLKDTAPFLTLDATTNNGAIISGKFVGINEPVEISTYVVKGIEKHPILVKVQDSSVVLKGDVLVELFSK